LAVFCNVATGRLKNAAYARHAFRDARDLELWLKCVCILL